MLLSTGLHNSWALWQVHNVEQAVGGVAALYATCRSLAHICRHISHNRTKLQACTVRILAVVPIFALDSWACLMLQASVHRWAEVLSFAREVYEAVAMCAFLQFILTYLGGPSKLAQTLGGGAAGVRGAERGPVPHLGPMRFALRPYEVGDDFVASVVMGILQYVFVTLCLFVVNLVVWRRAMDQDAAVQQPSIYIQALPKIAKALSCGWAMYHLVLLYGETRGLLDHIRPMWKFVCIKGIIFFTFYQGLVLWVLGYLGVIPPNPMDVTGRVWSQTQIASGIKSFLLCIEMVVFCEMHRHAYPYDEWDSGASHHTFPLHRKVAETLAAAELASQPKALDATNFVDILGLWREVSALRMSASARSRRGRMEDAAATSPLASSA